MLCVDIPDRRFLTMITKIKSYSELIKLDNYSDRLEYLYIGDKVGNTTFGSNRWLNQRFYTSKEWLRTRDEIIIRDNGCDLGVDGCELNNGNIMVHHINPITEDDLIHMRPNVFDPENLISSSRKSHNFIHYGIKQEESYTERTPNDTCPWKRERR